MICEGMQNGGETIGLASYDFWCKCQFMGGKCRTIGIASYDSNIRNKSEVKPKVHIIKNL